MEKEWAAVSAFFSAIVNGVGAQGVSESGKGDMKETCICACKYIPDNANTHRRNPFIKVLGKAVISLFVFEKDKRFPVQIELRATFIVV